MAIYPDRAGALGAMGSYDANNSATNTPLNPNLAGQQQQAENMAARRAADIAAASAAANVSTAGRPQQRQLSRPAQLSPEMEGVADMRNWTNYSDAFTMGTQPDIRWDQRAPAGGGGFWSWMGDKLTNKGPNLDSALAMAGVDGPKRNRNALPTTGTFEVISDEDKARAYTLGDPTSKQLPAGGTATTATELVNQALADAIRNGTGNGVVTAGGRVITPDNVSTQINSIDLAGANAAMARANESKAEARRIRMEMMDGVAPGTYARGGSGDRVGALQELLRSLPLREIGQPTGRKDWQRNGRTVKANMDYNRELIQSALAGMFGLEQQGLANQGGLDRAQMQGANNLAVTQLSGANQIAADNNKLAQARTPEARFEVERAAFNEQYLNILAENGEDSEEAAALRKYWQDRTAEWVAQEEARLAAQNAAIGGETENFAEGGLVRGAGYGGAPDAMSVTNEINRYRQYAVGAKALGLPVVSFEQFLSVGDGGRAQAQPQGALAFAKGGLVPGDGDPHSVGGKVVVDPDPQAPVDSIPAVIDGTRPAKLDSGEFVIPSDVVLHYGTDKLNKLIDAARQKGASQKE